LDAIGFLIKMLGLDEKEPSTNCFGVEETHAIIKAFREILADLCPQAVQIAEVNAPKEISDTYYWQSR